MFGIGPDPKVLFGTPKFETVGVGRNTGRGFDYASLDMRLSRRFRITERLDLDLLAEGFNLLNRSSDRLRAIHGAIGRFTDGRDIENIGFGKR